MVSTKRMGIHPGQATFDHNKAKYTNNTLCCGKEHCLVLTNKIALSRCYFLFLTVCIMAYWASAWGIDIEFILPILLFILEANSVFLLFQGMNMIRPWLLLPFLAFVLCQIAFVVFLDAGIILIAIFPPSLETIKHYGISKVPEETTVLQMQIACVILSLLFLLVATILLWTFLVTSQCFSYLQDVQRYLRKSHIKTIA